jgi:FtsH-binding integral membrane protein
VRTIAWLAGIGTLMAGVFYMVISLNRWEWNRALFFGLIVLIAEIALATGLVLRRIARLEHNLKGPPADQDVVQILRETRPSRDRFAWMRESPGQLNVFITFLVGGGVILSGVAWMVDRLASKTSSPAGEERLARQLYPISYPSGGLLLDDITVLAQDVPGADDGQIRQLLRRGGRPS